MESLNQALHGVVIQGTSLFWNCIWGRIHVGVWEKPTWSRQEKIRVERRHAWSKYINIWKQLSAVENVTATEFYCILMHLSGILQYVYQSINNSSILSNLLFCLWKFRRPLLLLSKRLQMRHPCKLKQMTSKFPTSTQSCAVYQIMRGNKNEHK